MYLVRLAIAAAVVAAAAAAAAAVDCGGSAAAVAVDSYVDIVARPLDWLDLVY